MTHLAFLLGVKKRETALWGFFCQKYILRVLYIEMKLKFRSKKHKTEIPPSSMPNVPKTKIRSKNKYQRAVNLAFRFRKKMVVDKIDVYSAQACFNILMGIIPLLMLVLALLRFTPITEDMVMDTLSSLITSGYMDQVKAIVSSVYQGSLTALSFSIIAVIWVSGKGVMGLANGLNNIYHLRENRNYFYIRGRSSLYTIPVVAMMAFGLTFLVYGVRFQMALESLFPIMRNFSRAVMYIFIVIGLLFLTLIFNLLYSFLPSVHKTFRSQRYGAIFTTIAWIIFSFFFQLWVTLSKNLSILYGGLLTIIIALTWMYFLVYIFFLGAEINDFIENPNTFPE